MLSAPCPLFPRPAEIPSPELKQQLTVHSKRVAGSVTELIQAAEAMKGKGDQGREEEGKPLFWGELCFRGGCEMASAESSRMPGPGDDKHLPGAPGLLGPSLLGIPRNRMGGPRGPTVIAENELLGAGRH